MFKEFKELSIEERYILISHIAGFSNKEIAELIKISTRTITRKLSNIRKKLKKDFYEQT